MSVTTRAIGAPSTSPMGRTRSRAPRKSARATHLYGSGDSALGQLWHPDQTFCRAWCGSPSTLTCFLADPADRSLGLTCGGRHTARMRR